MFFISKSVIFLDCVTIGKKNNYLAILWSKDVFYYNQRSNVCTSMLFFQHLTSPFFFKKEKCSSSVCTTSLKVYFINSEAQLSDKYNSDYTKTYYFECILEFYPTTCPPLTPKKWWDTYHCEHMIFIIHNLLNSKSKKLKYPSKRNQFKNNQKLSSEKWHNILLQRK